jgi:uncharacterized membrane protein
MMKIFRITLLAFCALMAIGARAQDSEKVLVPKSILTPEQLDEATKGDLKTNVHEWAGLGKEVGEAVNQSLSAITEQANTFAKTGVGKLTVILVVWKVIGDQAVHVLFGLVELLVFLPLWIWSYRRTCLTRRFQVEKGKWQVVEYKPTGEFTMRMAHLLTIAGITAMVLVTVFSY